MPNSSAILPGMIDLTICSCFFPVICYSPYLLFILSHTITHLNLFAKTVLHQYNIHTKEAALEFQAEK
jgi:hypothetical protein